jgi:aryl-phospho-beta-D-glucosidase BglC (GH1 family)
MKIFKLTLKTAIISILISSFFPACSVETNRKKELTEVDFIKASGRNLRNKSGEGDIVNLRGVNVGGFLLQEFWMTPTNYSTRANAQTDIIMVLTERFGEETMYELVDLYQRSYFKEEYFDLLADMGVNVLRLPFWYRNLVDADGDFYDYDPANEDPFASAFKYVDWFAEQAGKRGIYIILDMHGAPGSQSGSDHSGKDGGDKKEEFSEFFFGPNAPVNQELFYKIWEVIAKRYIGNPVIAGFDLLNEPFCTWRYTTKLSASELYNMLWSIYDEAYRRIRAINPDHLIILGATWDPIDLPHPAKFNWTNIMYKYHNYAQGSPTELNNENYVISNMHRKLNLIRAASYDVPNYIGEFNYFGNLASWESGLELFNSLGINWTSWTFKTTPNQGNWGIYHHRLNVRVNIETDSLDRIREVWGNAGSSVPNTRLIEVMSRYLKAPVVPSVL